MATSWHTSEHAVSGPPLFRNISGIVLNPDETGETMMNSGSYLGK
jgi:hypothetical protein